MNGSGIGLGHPVGVTGARIIVTHIHEMKKKEFFLRISHLMW
ncbi:MAG: hypothetical protein ACW98D_02420 [Promethearchaeota archaeon]